MGSIKKALKPVTRVIDDIIPNEIKPALPYIAAYIWCTVFKRALVYLQEKVF